MERNFVGKTGLHPGADMSWSSLFPPLDSPEKTVSTPSDFFILGCPRSGTTLLQAMLNRHPEVAIPPETKLFCYYHRQPVWIRRRCLQRLRADLQITLPDSLACRSTSTVEAWQWIRSAYLQKIERPEVRIVGEKTPEHTTCVREIYDCFPAARLVVVVRNGIHVAHSLTGVPWIKCSHVTGARIWAYYMEHIERLQAERASTVHLVRYEELLMEPVAVLRGVFRFLGVAEESAAECTQPNPDLDAGVFPVREFAWKSKAIRAIESRHLLPPANLTRLQWRQILGACGPVLRRWGYAVADEERTRVDGPGFGRVAYRSLHGRELPGLDARKQHEAWPVCSF